MKKNLIRIMMVAALAIALPISSWALGTPAGFTLDLSTASSSPVPSNPLQQQMTNGSINISVTNPLTGTTTTATSSFDLLWEFNYANNHLQIVGVSQTGGTGTPAQCLVSRTVTVTDSRSGAALVGAAVTIGTVTQVTNATGVVTFTNIAANRASLSINIQASAAGHTPSNTPVAITCGGGGGATTISLVSNTVPTGNVTIVLTWGTNPRDLDSHLTGPRVPAGATRFHVYFGASNRLGLRATARQSLASIPAFLDIDDTSSFGPETITIVANAATGVVPDGLYRYTVHHFSGLNTIGSSGAVVKVFQGGRQLSTFTPNATTGGRKTAWTVFEINVVGGVVSIVRVNTYANVISSGTVRSVTGPGVSAGAAVATPLGVTVHGEDPALFMNMPAKP